MKQVALLACVALVCAEISGCAGRIVQTSSSRESDLRSYADRLRHASLEITPMPRIPENLSTEERRYLLASLLNLAEDESERVRSDAYGSIWFIGVRSDDWAFRREVVQHLLYGALHGDDDALPGNDPVKQSIIADFLRRRHSFTSADFNDDSKSMIRKLLAPDPISKRPPMLGEILLCGMANMIDEIPRLKSYIREEFFVNDMPSEKDYLWWQGPSWQSIRALARMGVSDEVARAIRLTENEPLLTRCTKLFQDISYIMDMEVVEYLNGYVQGDEIVHGTICDAPDPGVPVAAFAASALWYMLEDFPCRPSTAFMPPEDIERCREWMKDRANWKLKKK